MQLECVASGGRFVIFVALQGEGRNANVEVGTVRPFNTERPPKQESLNEFNIASSKLVTQHKSTGEYCSHGRK